MDDERRAFYAFIMRLEVNTIFIYLAEFRSTTKCNEKPLSKTKVVNCVICACQSRRIIKTVFHSNLYVKPTTYYALCASVRVLVQKRWHYNCMRLRMYLCLIEYTLLRQRVVRRQYNVCWIFMNGCALRAILFSYCILRDEYEIIHCVVTLAPMASWPFIL